MLIMDVFYFLPTLYCESKGVWILHPCILGQCNLHSGAVYFWSDHLRYTLESSVNRAWEMFCRGRNSNLHFPHTLRDSENNKGGKKINNLEHISQLSVPFLLPEDRQSVCRGHGTPLSDHIRHKQPEMKRYGDYRDKKPPSLSRDAERIVHPHVLNTNLSPSVTAPFITHKANPVSGTMRSIRPSSLPLF